MLELNTLIKKTDNNTQNNPAKVNNTTTANQTTSTNVLDDSFYRQNNNENFKQNATASEAQRILEQMNKSSLFNTNANFNHSVNNETRTREGLVQLVNNQRGTICVDMDDDGTKEEMSLVDAIAASHDSELDIYIEEQISAIQEKTGGRIVGQNNFLSSESLEFLSQKGIKVDKINDRTYTFSLVDKDGNVLEDSNGKKGSVIFSDCVIPDGYADGAEANLGSILDSMGYDCISKADFIGHEGDYEKVLSEIESNINQGVYKGDTKVEDIYGGAQSFSNTLGSHSKGSYSSGTNGTRHKKDDDIDVYRNDKEYDSDDQSRIFDDYKAALKAQKNEYKEQHNSSPKREDFDRLKQKAKDVVIQQYGEVAREILEKI